MKSSPPSMTDRTLEVWQSRTSRVLTREDARQIGESMTGFFQTLLDWEAVERCAEERAERTQPPASSKVIRRARR